MAQTVVQTRKSALDKVQGAVFDGITFPIKSLRIEMETRYHEHVYLKTPGAATEKMARGLYRFEMLAAFDTNITTHGKLWPDKLATLRAACESQRTADLIVPTLGTVKAWMPKWAQEVDFRVRSGEVVHLVFLEDASQQSLDLALKQVDRTSMVAKQSALQNRAAALLPGERVLEDQRLPDGRKRLDIFTAIQNAVNDVLAIKDQQDAFGNLLAARLEALAQMVRDADKFVKALEHPSNYGIVDALHDLLDATLELAGKNSQRAQVLVYHTQRQMSVSQISAAIYKGDATHAVEIMQNNALEDPLAVPAGTGIFYFVNVN